MLIYFHCKWFFFFTKIFFPFKHFSFPRYFFVSIPILFSFLNLSPYALSKRGKILREVSVQFSRKCGVSVSRICKFNSMQYSSHKPWLLRALVGLLLIFTWYCRFFPNSFYNTHCVDLFYTDTFSKRQHGMPSRQQKSA